MSQPKSGPFLSVVIPIYNAAQYIEACLNSILTQKGDIEYEIVCVNDGSNDDSANILNEFAARVTNIRVEHQQNGGVTSARRRGVEISSGEWITFVDVDDTLSPDTFLEYSNACTNEYDIVIGEFLERHDATIKSIDLYREQIIKCRVSTAPWAKAFRRKLFDKSTFDIPREIRFGEDMLMNVRLAFNTEKPVNFIGKIIYNYNSTASSAAHTFIKTPDYEDRFSELLCKSIPETFLSDLRYRHAVISANLNGWKTLNFLKLSTRQNRDTDFYRHLVSAIKEYKYPLNWQDKIQVYGHSLPMRLIAIYLNLYPVLKYKIKCIRKHIEFLISHKRIYSSQ